MIDSHALAGSCAQVGKRVHVSALPRRSEARVLLGDARHHRGRGALVGGNTGVYEGTIVRERAVLAPDDSHGRDGGLRPGS
ncbi:MAG: hypothetical protein R2882_00600 [Gemmatimonadales bacterium]